MNHQPKNIAARLGLCLLFAGTGLIGANAAPQAAQAPVAKYGPFSISNMAQMQSSQSKGTGKITVKMDGPNLSAKSSRYDITSPHITLNLAKVAAQTGKPSQLRAQTATATGGATVVFRNPDQDETTTVTCERANYAATNAAKNLGRLTMIGNVRSVTRGQAYGDVPLVQTWKTFYVEFTDADTIVTGGEAGFVNGAIREPAPRPKSGAATGAPKQ